MKIIDTKTKEVVFTHGSMYPVGADAASIEAAADRAEAAAADAEAVLVDIDGELATAGSRFRTDEPWTANLPWYNVSPGSIPPPKAHAFFMQDTSIRNDATTVTIQRLVKSSDGLANPKALRVVTTVQTDTPQTEWAISGELDNYSNTASTGNTAVSGVANKYGTASVFGGHFQAKDWVIATGPASVSALLGCEINTPAVGLDHPTANNNTGLRRTVDLIARTNRQVSGWNTATGNSGEAEIGVGIMLRSDNLTGGYFRYGMVIDDVSQTGNPNPIGTALLVRTTGTDGVVVGGANAGAAIRVNPTIGGSFGFRVNGSFTIGAIGINSGQYITMSTDGTRKVRYSPGTDSFEFFNGPDNRAALRVNASPALTLGGTQVVGQQRPAIANAGTGSEVETINSILAALRAHGLIAT